MAKYLLKLKFVVQTNILQQMRNVVMRWSKNKEHNHAKSVSSINDNR